jgi:hypothetical protein
MARTPLDNEYRRINDRMQKLWETYGADNPTYQQYASQVQANFNINILPDGRVQIKQGKSNANINLFQRRALNDMMKMDTRGSLRKQAKQYAKEHGLGKSANIDELVEKQEYVKDNRDLITWVSQQIKSGATITDNLANLYNRAAGRSDELSYDELYDLINKALPDKELYM